MIPQLATLPEHPESVPINALVAVAGTPLEGSPPVEALDLVRHAGWVASRVSLLGAWQVMVG